MDKRILLSWAFVISLVLLPITSTWAVSEISNQGTAQQSQNFSEQACARIQERVQTKLNNFENRKDNHVAVYNKVRERVQNLVGRLNEAGYDTTQLTAHLQEFNQQIQDFGNHYSEYAGSLSETHSYACERSQGEFRNQLQAARGLLATVHGDTQKLRTYYNETLKVDIQTLRAQIAADQTDTI